mgnify:CR=1 FL=1
MEQLEQAKQVALKFVSVRMRTEQDVEQMLQKKGYDRKTVQTVVAFLKRYQYLDDAAYCRSWIHDKVQFHPCGRKKMAFELSKKIADHQLICDSLTEYFPEEAELEQAITVAQKKIDSSGSNLRREQLSRFLYSRGYGGSVIDTVLQKHEIEEQLDRRQCDNNFS